ncbi:MAG TPA: DUF4124 domain-containing protein [Steroidobacteraceae bacterium]|nr:DUF4124 domain-containing protein [Steroidobacteraceae bacterium]
MLRKIALATIAIAAASAAYADVYRWVDEHGSVHYSDQWMPGAEVIKAVKPRPPSDSGSSTRSSSRSPVTSDRAAAQIAEQNQAQAMKQDVSKVREQQCKEAKDRYQKAIVARRIFTPGKEGEKDVDGQPVRHYISDEEADAYRTKARAEMQEACGPAATAKVVAEAAPE